MASTTTDSGKRYRTECTGLALQTAKAHAAQSDVILFGACFCPFVHRVWIAFELLDEPYQYCMPFIYGTAPKDADAIAADEVDPYAKPADLLAVSPKGLVPALRFRRDQPRSLHESTIILEYFEDLAAQKGLSLILPDRSDPYARAQARLLGDHINRVLVPAFYRYLQAQDPDAHVSGGKEFNNAISTLVEKLEKAPQNSVGLWNQQEAETRLGWADVMAGPWLYRATVVLKHYRGWTPPGESSKTTEWIRRIVAHPVFARTTSTDDLYLDSYERYAFNRPNTSQVANAINAGKGLP
ncbi:glutathione S-transferase [Auricularia subglabra TFB-10046 SS5]|nr:glutathione S-transferase [Auricularia subglabra TFB-10046 SS5]